jgi:hypothetical protein
MTTPETPSDTNERRDGAASREPASNDPDAVFERNVIAGAAGVLRVTAMCGVIAAALGAVIAPGLRGVATEAAVDLGERLSATFAYAFYALLVTLLLGGAMMLSRAKDIPVAVRFVAVTASGLVVALSLQAVFVRLHPTVAMIVAISSSATAAACGAQSLRKAHTRAVGAVILALGMASIFHLGAWEIAAAAGERMSVSLYVVSRAVATTAIVVAALAQLAAAAWIGTRGGIVGRILANIAIALAFIVTWAAARGGIPEASLWQAVLHTSMSDAAGLPPPFKISALAVFLAPSAILLAAAAITQPRQIAIVAPALTLALISRGALDVPIQAMAISVPAQWLLISSGDPRAAWKALTTR